MVKLAAKRWTALVDSLGFGATALMLMVLAGCGYTFKGAGSVLPQDVKKVYVPLVENSSVETGVSTLLTESLRDQFERYGVLTVVDDIDEADAIVKARILKVTQNTRSTTGGRTDLGLQYDATLFVQAEMRRTTGALLWKNPSLVVTKTFGSSKDSVVTGSVDFLEGTLSSSDLDGLDSREVQRGQRGEALQYLAEQMAITIYDDAVAPDF